MKLRSAVFCFGIFCSGLTQAQGTPFVVASTHIDQVRSPKNVFDKIRECSNNNLCSNMLKAVEIYYQIPRDQLQLSLQNFPALPEVRGGVLT